MQIQLQYNVYEDRLLLVIADEDQNRAWWITRRASRMLAETFVKRLSDSLMSEDMESARDLILSLRQEEAIQNTPIITAPSLPVEHPNLLTSIRHGSQDNGNHIIVLVGMDGEEQALTFDDDALLVLVELFRQQLLLTDWELVLQWPHDSQDTDAMVKNIQ